MAARLILLAALYLPNIPSAAAVELGAMKIWQRTDSLLGTPPRGCDDPRLLKDPRLRSMRITPRDRESPSWTWADEFATAMQLGEVQVDSWDVPVYFGRSELGRTRMHEGPYHSISRLRRIKEKYFPVVQKYVDAAGKGDDGDGGSSGRKEMLDGWIPRIRSEKLEARVKDAIGEQWRLGIAPGQKNDELRLPRTLPDPEKQYFHYFQSVDHDNESDEAAETTSEEASPEKVEEVRTLERTFGFGYQLLRSCAVDGYESDFFQKEIEEKWIQAFAKSKEWIDRALLAMFPPPGAGLASFGKIGEDSLPEGEPAFRSQVKRDRELLWVGLRTMRARVGESASPLFGSFAGACSSEEDSTADEEARAEQARAVREVFDFPVDVDRLNRSDHEQRNTGNRLSLHPDGLTLAQLWLFRYRRSVIEGQRQKEDLKFYAGAGTKVLQAAFMPFAFAYTGANNLNNPMRDTPCPFNSRELAQELEKAANTVKGGTTLSPKAKELARQAAKLIDLGHKMRDQISAGLAVDVSRELDETATVLSGGIGEARSRKVREASTLEKTYADNPCVRLSAWLVRHQVPSRMWRHNLRHRLKVLQGDGEVFGGEHLSQADLVERELPTAVGPLNDDLVLKENQEYTNLFFLLRDNVEKPLSEFPTLKWQDFDHWALEYPELVRKTPWDNEYVPPWEWKDGKPPVRRFANGKERHYHNLYVLAVCGVGVFAAALLVVSFLLERECRRVAKFVRSKVAKKSNRGVAGRRKKRSGSSLASESKLHEDGSSSPCTVNRPPTAPALRCAMRASSPFGELHLRLGPRDEQAEAVFRQGEAVSDAAPAAAGGPPAAVGATSETAKGGSTELVTLPEKLPAVEARGSPPDTSPHSDAYIPHIPHPHSSRSLAAEFRLDVQDRQPQAQAQFPLEGHKKDQREVAREDPAKKEHEQEDQDAGHGGGGGAGHRHPGQEEGGEEAGLKPSPQQDLLHIGATGEHEQLPCTSSSSPEEMLGDAGGELEEPSAQFLRRQWEQAAIGFEQSEMPAFNPEAEPGDNLEQLNRDQETAGLLVYTLESIETDTAQESHTGTVSSGGGRKDNKE